MSKWDYDKIKDMEYEPDRERYIGDDGSELKVTPFSNGTGYKYDYYDKSTYGNTQHNSTHVKANNDGSWEKTENSRDTGKQEKSSGIGCYLTTACMQHYKNNFDDNCHELTTLRWLRDNIVTSSDTCHYYEISPIIVESILKSYNHNVILSIIYEKMVLPCVEAVEHGNYEIAYKIYKECF